MEVEDRARKMLNDIMKVQGKRRREKSKKIWLDNLHKEGHRRIQDDGILGPMAHNRSV